MPIRVRGKVRRPRPPQDSTVERQLKVVMFALDHLDKLGHKIMTKISEFAERQKAHNDRMDAAVAGVTSDVAELKRLIEELQNSPGDITPEDQASLDALEVRAAGIADKLDALDALTPPTPPVA